MTRILACALAIVTVILSACGGTEDATAAPAESVALTEAPSESAAEPTVTQSSSPTAEPSATAVGEADLTVQWAVPFTITAPADWAKGEAAVPSAADVVDGTGLRTVLAMVVKAGETPEDWIERLTTSTALVTTDPQEAEVGGAPGFVLDIRMEESADGCVTGGSDLGGICYVIHGPENGWAWVIEGGRPARMWVLDVAGETVLLWSDAREDRFEDWATTIEGVVATLKWQ